jgi:hypothetical protein
MPKKFSDVVVLIPGIMGSVLKKDGREIWSLSGGSLLRALFSLGGSAKSLELPNDDPSVDDLGDGVIADRLFPDIHIVPGFWKIDGYSKAAQYLIDAFNLERGGNYFEFPYDWRRDNRVAARRLATEARGWLADWRRSSGNTTAKLILVAHSMGGVVSRYFLEILEGWRDTRMLITFGTPYRGSLNALNFISNGYRKKVGPVTLIDLTELLRSFTSVYQLLPIYPCIDLGDSKMVRVNETSRVPKLDPEMAAAALEFHNEIRNAAEDHRREEEYLQNRYKICPIVGTYQETLQSAVLKGSTLEMLCQHSGEDLAGDGTVPRVSAVPIGEESQLLGRSVATRHSSLQNSDDALNQVEYMLRGLTIDDLRFRAATPAACVGLAVEDVYSSREPIHLRVRCDDPSRELVVSLQAAETQEEVAHRRVEPDGENWTGVEFQSMRANCYRIAVGGKGVQTAEDVFAVLDP